MYTMTVVYDCRVVTPHSPIFTTGELDGFWSCCHDTTYRHNSATEKHENPN